MVWRNGEFCLALLHPRNSSCLFNIRETWMCFYVMGNETVEKERMRRMAANGGLRTLRGQRAKEQGLWAQSFTSARNKEVEKEAKVRVMQLHWNIDKDSGKAMDLDINWGRYRRQLDLWICSLRKQVWIGERKWGAICSHDNGGWNSGYRWDQLVQVCRDFWPLFLIHSCNPSIWLSKYLFYIHTLN